MESKPLYAIPFAQDHYGIDSMCVLWPICSLLRLVDPHSRSEEPLLCSQDRRDTSEDGSQKAKQAPQVVVSSSDGAKVRGSAFRQRAPMQQLRWVCCFAPGPGHVAA